MMSTNTASDGAIAGFKGAPTILVVDDEELMREVVAIMVEENGGTAITACDGQEAVDIYTEKHSEIDFVFLDFSMPRKNGYEAYLEIKKINPDVKAVMVSGLKLIPEVEKLKERGEVVFLSKPFHESELVATINTFD